MLAMADERECTIDRFWLLKQGVLEEPLFTILGGASQDHWEFLNGLTLIRALSPHIRTILEIGVYGGWTMRAWLDIGGPEATAIGVDMLLRPSTPFPPSVRLIEGDSHDPVTIARVKALLPTGVDLLHIDGDHTLQGCLDDYNNFAPLIREKGVLVFHDILSGDVRATWREVVKQYPTVQIQNKDPKAAMGMGLAFNLPHVGGFKPIRVDE